MSSMSSMSRAEEAGFSPPCHYCHEPDPPRAVLQWDVPGQRFGDADPLPDLSHRMQLFLEQLTSITTVDPTSLSREQALVDVEALLGAAEQLRVHLLGRLADFHERRLQDLTDKRTASSWVEQTSPDTERGDLLLGRRLGRYRVLAQQVEQGAITVGAAKKVALALATLSRHVDRPDGLVDGQPGFEVIPAVVRHVVQQVAETRLGLGSDSEELTSLHAAVETILAEGGSDLEQLEKAFTVLAASIPANAVRDALGQLQDALLPNILEQRARRGEDVAGVTLKLKHDGSGWDLHGDLDLETGELLFTALGAEARRDEGNSEDTADAQALRNEGRDPYDDDVRPASVTLRWPRRRARRLHDGLRNLLQRYLSADLGGEHDKRPVRIGVTLSSDLVEGKPGAPPGIAVSGARLPESLLRRWWCNASVTVFLMSRGWIPLGRSHTQRTLTGDERLALDLQSGGHRCAGVGCCTGQLHPLAMLEPHHALSWESTGKTALAETIWACPALHHDLHHGKTVRLRSGRRLNEAGWVA